MHDAVGAEDNQRISLRQHVDGGAMAIGALGGGGGGEGGG